MAQRHRRCLLLQTSLLASGACLRRIRADGNPASWPHRIGRVGLDCTWHDFGVGNWIVPDGAWTALFVSHNSDNADCSIGDKYGDDHLQKVCHGLEGPCRSDSRRPRPLEVIAAKPACHIHNFANKIETCLIASGERSRV